jgi:DNA-binding LacI/PurR family transcriptional regulator
MRPNKKVTIKDVAKAAGVSTQTVSRVINNRHDVSPETRAHVQQVIDNLGYSPNIIARSLSQGRTNTLGVVGFGLEYFGSFGVLTGIEHRAHELGFSLLLSLLDCIEPFNVDQSFNELLSRQVDGIIWAVHWQVDTFKWLGPKFEEIDVPLVFLNKSQRGNDVVVAMNNRLGGRLATEHLLEQGYRRIGVITGPTDWWEAKEREAGWREAMEQTGINDLDRLKVVGDWWAASGDVGLYTLYARSPKIEAVFACNDQMALGAMQAARRLGLKIPDDLAIVGFDDVPEAAYFYPSLTTIQQDVKALGALAVEQMSKLIRARHDGEDFNPDISWIAPGLIVRQSSRKNNQ